MARRTARNLAGRAVAAGKDRAERVAREIGGERWGVKAQIQGDELRVSSKKRDDLQAVQQLVKSQDYDFAVQFTNYR